MFGRFHVPPGSSPRIFFAQFDFINAAITAQAAHRASAHYRDLALGLAPGTSELERGTAKAGAAAWPSAK